MIFDDTLEKVRDMLAEQIGISPDVITPNCDLAEDLGADSLDAAELLVKAEDEFDIFIPDDDVVAFRTVSDIAKCIENMLKIK